MSESNSNPRTLITVAIITGVFGIISAIISGVFAYKAAETQKQVISTNTALVKEIVSGNATQSSLAQDVFSGNATQSSLEQTIVAPTATLSVTQTPSPTNTPSLPSFFDDFELGVKPEWITKYGNVGMSQGKFTILSPFDGHQSYHLAVLDLIDFTNLRIDVNMSKLEGGFNCFDCVYTAETAIIIRYAPNGEGIGLRIFPGPNSLAFAKFDEMGNWEIINSSMVIGGDNFNFNRGDNVISVEVKGNTYFAYVNNRLATSITLDGFSLGKVGLWFKSSPIRNELDWYAPRFEDFKVQMMP